jgi:uncharacterized protein YjbI with pentapeptide repeats
MKRQWLLFLSIFGLVVRLAPVILLLVGALWWLPKWQLAPYIDRLDAKDAIALENSVRQTVAQALGGLALLIGLLLTWRNLRITQRTSEETLRIAEEGKITDRFSKAIEQLGNETIEIKLGGIYALERIARDSEKDHQTIMEVLTTFIRERSPNLRRYSYEDEDGMPMEPPTEEGVPRPAVQAALTVIGRRMRIFENGEDQPLDLFGTSLWDMNLDGAHLEGANLSESRLDATRFRGASLMGSQFKMASLLHANLREANLARANLESASLRWADLEDANLTESQFDAADLENANLRRANLNRAHLVRANLKGARIREANLEGANLGFASFEGVVFESVCVEGALFLQTNLRGADLSEAVFRADRVLDPEVVKKQLLTADIDESTKLPPAIRKVLTG